MLEFAGLVFLLLMWERDWWGFSTDFPAVLHGIMPIAVPWFGALGGVTNGLWSIQKYWPNYDSLSAQVRDRERRTWAAWTVTQPFVGAVFGTVAVLIVVLLTQTVTVNVGDATTPISTGGMGIMAAVSFTVGFRQKTFQDLITRVTDTILGPGGTSSETTSFSLDTGALTFETTKLAPQSQQLKITNLGTRPLQMSSSALRLTQDDPPVFSRGTAADVKPGESVDLPVTFNPAEHPAPAGGVWKGSLAITFGDVTRTVDLSGTLKDA